MRLYSVGTRDNCSDQKKFCERLHHSKLGKQLSKISLLELRYEKKTVTESSHNLIGVKTILSVRSQRQHLFVLDKTILTLINILFSARSTSTTPPTVRCSVSFPRKHYTIKTLKIVAIRPLSFLFVLTL